MERSKLCCERFRDEQKKNAFKQHGKEEETGTATTAASPARTRQAIRRGGEDTRAGGESDRQIWPEPEGAHLVVADALADVGLLAVAVAGLHRAGDGEEGGGGISSAGGEGATR